MQKKNSTLRIALAQLNACVGDVKGNLQKVQDALLQAKAQQVDLILFPEVVLSGYPAEDLWYRPDFIDQMETGIATLAAQTHDLTAIVGVPLLRDGVLRNMACILRDGQIIAE